MILTLKQIAEATGGTLFGEDIEINGISTDTRTISEGMLFVPIKGENFDGHEFIDKAIEKGAFAFLSNRQIKSEESYVLVKDTRKALGDIARFYKALLGVKTVGVTGSTGKTTTKDIIAAVLSKGFKTLKTEGNFNNDIGVPLTLFRLTEKDKATVIEMGMNHFGELSNLTSIACPDIAVITNVGVSHIENLGSREGILKAKCEIFESMADGAKIVNGDDDMLCTIKDKYTNVRFFSVKDKNADIYADDIKENGLDGISCTIHIGGEKISVNIPVPGMHMVYNAMAAAGVAHELGISFNKIKEGIEEFKPTKMRMDIIKLDNITIINDVYNSNPVSAKAGIDVLAGVKGDKLAILGDMLELGDFSEKLHAEVGEYTAEKGIPTVCIGKESKAMYDACSEKVSAWYFETVDKFLAQKDEIIKNGTTVLVKASRGMKFERITEALKNE